MAERARVVHVDDSVPGAVYVGRAVPRRGIKASPFGNPYRLGEVHGDHAKAVALYRRWLATQP